MRRRASAPGPAPAVPAGVGPLALLALHVGVLALPACSPEGVPTDGAPAARRSAPVSYDGLVSGMDRRIDALAARADSLPASFLAREHLANALSARARLSGDLEDLVAADSVLSMAFSLAPPGAGPFLSRARVRFALHRLDEVEPDLERAERRVLLDDETRAAIAALRGDVALERGEHAAALAAYETAAALDDDPGHLWRFARLFRFRGEAAAAESLLARARATPLVPQIEAERHLLLGLLDLERGAPLSARAHYGDAASIVSNWWLVTEHIAEADAILGDTAAAIAGYEAALTGAPRPLLLSALAGLLAATGRDVDAARLLASAREGVRVALERAPDAALGTAARHALATGDAGAAVAFAARDHAARPGAESGLVLAESYLAAGLLEDAIATIDALLATPFRSVALHETAAAAFAAIGRADRAAAHEGAARALAAPPREFGDR